MNRFGYIDPWEDVPAQFVPYDDALAGYQFGTGYRKYANAIYIARQRERGL